MSGRVKPSKRVRAREAHGPEYEQASALYESFTGHQAEPLGSVNVKVPSVALCVGECDGILYTTVRDGVVEKYIHKFKAKAKPMLCASPDGKSLFLVEGDFTFTERGIVDN
jgi:hypothetical protein